MSHLFCFGLGYCATALARRLLAQGWDVTGTARMADGVARLTARGFSALAFAGTRPEASIADALARATHVLISVPPDAAPGGIDSVLRWHAGDLARSGAAWIGYLSTVGVYGDHQGAWVDEDTPLRPVSERSRRRVAAERAWLDFGARAGKSVHIFRLAGIYGPGRSAIDNVRDGTARRLFKADQVFNRIHVDDIAAVLEASMAQPRAGAVYNVADLEPAPPQDVVAYAAGLLGAVVPPLIAYEQAGLSPMGLSFYGENKRVSSALAIAELGVTFAHPTYREGLASCLRNTQE